MASASGASLPLRRQASTNSLHREDDNNDLARSLKQLTISTSPVRGSSHLSEPTTPFRSSVRRSSHSPHPRSRPPSRSPSNGRDSLPGTPNLLRKASMNSLRSSNGPKAGQTPMRRSSSANILSPSHAKASPLAPTPPTPEKPRPTADSIAKDCFKSELEVHHGSIATRQTETVVILNDAVYGHRFSRPRTSRSALSTIVERPERIKAGVLGISAAYVCLGERHSEGAFPPHPQLDAHDLPRIPFRIQKTDRRLPLMSQAVTNVHGTKWMEELKIMCDAAESKLAMGGKELQRPDMNRGTSQAPEKFHEGDLYLCSESLEAIEGALGAVCEAVDTVFGEGPKRAFVGARPPGHHCSADHPSGFCWVNNVHVGIMHGMLNHGLTHAAIIDIDLHHGDGSQSITWQHNTRGITAAKNAAPWKKSSIGYFSLHDINSYPCEMGDEEKVKNASLCIDNAHGQTVWNVHLQPWKSEEDFWKLYESKYMVLLEKARNYLKNQAERLRLTNQPPKAAIFISAGFDASEWESAGMQRHKVNVPTEFYARVAQDVVKLAAEEGLHVDGRVISVLEGGYSDRALMSGIFSHMSGLVGDQTLQQYSHTTGGLGLEMGQKMGVVSQPEGELVAKQPTLASLHAYNPEWWASGRLDDLEIIMADPLSPPKKPRVPMPPTYFTPTQASSAKVVDPIKMRRSLSGLAQAAIASRPPSPPPPEVPWTIAVHELSKLLIPSGRQTESCKPEDLNAEATRARRDRQSILMGVPPAQPAPASRPTSRMALRERKPRSTAPIDDSGLDKSSRDRRKTVATTTVSGEKAVARGVQPESSGGQPVRRPSRRASEAPTAHRPDGTPPIPTVARASQGGAAQGVRPTAAMSVRARSVESLPVKKTRAPATRKEPVPRAPRGKKAAPNVSKLATSAKTKSPTKAGPNSNDAGDDIDQITSGMRKIRINLITQSQKDARELARLQAEKAASLPAGKQETVLPSIELPSASNTANASLQPVEEATSEMAVSSPPDFAVPPHPQMASSGSRIPTPPTTVSSSGPTTPAYEGGPFDGYSPGPQTVPLPASSPVTLPAINQSMDSPQDVFIPYQPKGPAPVAVAQHEALTWLPPNAPASSAATPAATPSPAKQGDNLFQYKGSSGIPFAPRQQTEVEATHEAKPEAESASSAWEIPETPQK